MRSISLLPFVARCLDTLDVCIWCMLFFMSVLVTVWNVSCVAAVVQDSVLDLE